jgi:hypothetical protein
MSRTAIIGSCITRDVWRECGVDFDGVLYVARTSLASLTSTPLKGVVAPSEPPAGVEGFGHNSLRRVAADLDKTALAAIVDQRPTHLIFDFIDERFGLLEQGGAIATHSWELDRLGLIGSAGLEAPKLIDRQSPRADALWRDGLAKIADLLTQPPLAQTRVILHHAQWALRFLDANGTSTTFDDTVPMWPGTASLTAQNALLRHYRDLFMQAAPRTHVVQASDRLQVADARHVWGLSPFHYVPDYYADVWRQLQGLGV